MNDYTDIYERANELSLKDFNTWMNKIDAIDSKISYETMRQKSRIELVVKKMYEMHNLRLYQLRKLDRRKEIKYYRHAFAYILHKILGVSLQNTAQTINRDNHATIKNSCNVIESLRDTKDPIYKELESFITYPY